MNNESNTPLLAMVTVALVLLYLVTHDNFSEIDRQHCRQNGMAYGGTGIMLDGYCVQGRTRVPAFTVGGE